MNHPLHALHVLLEQSERERDQALGRMNQARRQIRAAEDQATHLASYRDGYRERWARQFAQGATPDIVRCYQGFADRLDQAIGAHQHTLAQAQAMHARACDELTAHELRVASVRKLIERRLGEARRVDERHERKSHDELAQRTASPLHAGAMRTAPV